MPFLDSGPLGGRRMRLNAVGSTVKAGVIDGGVVNDGFVVDVGYMNVADVVHRGVVHEVAVIPIATLVADAPIAITVVNPAIEANVRTPVAGVKDVSAATPSPVSRSPE
jgi:hypothetical protein